MPTRLGGVSATVNGKPAYVYWFCSAATTPTCGSDQINVLTPLDDTVDNEVTGYKFDELSADALRHANLLVLGTTALRAVRHAPYPVFDGEWSRKVR